MKKCSSMGCREEAVEPFALCAEHRRQGLEAVAASRLRRREEANFCRSIGIRVPEGYDE